MKLTLVKLSLGNSTLGMPNTLGIRVEGIGPGRMILKISEYFCPNILQTLESLRGKFEGKDSIIQIKSILAANLLFIYLLPLTHPSTCLFIHLSIFLSIYPSLYPSIHLSIHLSIFLSIYQSFFPSIHLCLHLSIFLSIYPSLYSSFHLSLSNPMSILPPPSLIIS